MPFTGCLALESASIIAMLFLIIVSCINLLLLFNLTRHVPGLRETTQKISLWAIVDPWDPTVEKVTLS